MIKVVNVPNSTSKVIYNNSDIAYQLANIITKSKTTAGALRDIQELTGVPWYENDDVKDFASEQSKLLYDEILKVRDYLRVIEQSDALDKMASYLTGKKKNYILIETKLPKNLQLNRMHGDWTVGFGKNAKQTITTNGIMDNLN